MKKLVGILGGTFDPIHNGHIGIAEKLYNDLPFQEIRFIPCHQPVHRSTPGASSEQRYEMLQLALKNHPHFITDDCEIKRQGPSYTIDTLLELKKQIPEAPFALIMGHDAWIHFLSWRHAERILESTHIIIVNRPHFPLPRHGKLAELLNQHQVFKEQDLLEKRAGYIYEYPDTHFHIAAIDIRQKLKQGETISKLLPSNVAKYIEENNLYKKL